MRTVALLLACSLVPAAAQSARPARAEIAAVERSFDQRLQRFSIDTPAEVLGLTRGLYLDDYGSVFTVELNLLPAAGISPFRPTLTKDDVERIRQQKIKRLPELKNAMKEMLLAAAGSMDRLPRDQQVVLAVTLFFHGWESSAGIPHLIQMQARRDALLEVASNRQPRAALEQIIRVREE